MTRALLPWLVLTAACGFLPEDDFTGKRAGDGIAPWEDLGPTQVCLGNQYLGGPETTPGGLCSETNAPEVSCTSDDDCRSREACVCGRCTVAYCSVASDCRPGQVCTFTQNRCDTPCFGEDDCAGPEECVSGTCRGRCLVDADCQTGEVCDSQNFCVTADCADDSGCLASERCRLQRLPRQVLEPSPVIGDDRRVVLYLEVADQLQRDQTAIWRAVSSDGLSFAMSPAAPVVEDGTTARAPSVVRTPDGWAMYYEVGGGAELRVVTSVDGVSWSAPTTALAGGAGPAAARAPAAVVLPDGSVAVYYQIGDGAAIGLATGPIGGALTARGPVLDPGDVTIPEGAAGRPFWDGVQRITSPHAAITDAADGRSLRLWFAAWGRESGESVQFGEIVPIPPSFSIGYAAGDLDDPTNLVPWPYGPVVDRVSAFLSHHEELSPGVVQLPGAQDGDDAYLLYFVEADPGMDATGPDGPFELGRLGVMGNGAHARLTQIGRSDP